MKRFLYVILIAVAASFAAKQYIDGRAGAKARVPASEGRFFYYPELNVYYKEGTNDYIYPVEEMGVTTWATMQMPVQNPAVLGRSVLVQPNSGEIWRENDQHQLRYRQAAGAPGDLSALLAATGTLDKGDAAADSANRKGANGFREKDEGAAKVKKNHKKPGDKKLGKKLKGLWRQLKNDVSGKS